MMEKKILIIEDEAAIHKLISAALPDEFKVIHAYSADEGIRQAASFNPDVVLLDIGLPEKNGLEVLKRIREWTQLPIIIISARLDDEIKIESLNLGADDYVTKPFSMGELIARVNAALRRQAIAKNDGQSMCTVGIFELDIPGHIVRKNGVELHLTPTEFKLLSLLIKNVDKVISHRQLLKEVWGPGYMNDIQYLRVFMKQLRQKVEDTSSQPQWILTEPGIGYRFKSGE